MIIPEITYLSTCDSPDAIRAFFFNVAKMEDGVNGLMLVVRFRFRSPDSYAMMLEAGAGAERRRLFSSSSPSITAFTPPPKIRECIFNLGTVTGDVVS